MTNFVKVPALLAFLCISGVALADETVPSVQSEAGMDKGLQMRENVPYANKNQPSLSGQSPDSRTPGEGRSSSENGASRQPSNPRY